MTATRNNKVYVTGFGIISAIGCGEAETFSALQRKQSGIGTISYLETALKNHPVAEVKKSAEELAHLAALPENIYSRTFLLGIIAAQQAMKMAGLQTAQGLLGATTVGGFELEDSHYRKLTESNDNTLLKKKIYPWMDFGICTEKIAEYFNIRSNVTTMSTACSSSANAIMFGARMIGNGLKDNILVGGMDSIAHITLNGFNALEILSPTGCRPFDQNRNGMTIGEGAAFLVLESEKSAQNKTIYGEIAGYANRNETFHQTASSPDGAGIAMAMRQALKVADIRPEDIDYINAHGTGTQNNDLSEGSAIGMVFDKNIPPVSSTKAYTGHTLAAAGAIEAVLSLLSIKEQTLLPNPRLETVMEELPFIPQSEMTKADIRYVLSNSLGFGGANTSLIIKKV
jgi:3-oxoacyl-[acyl-carrier-protein] synthase-1